LSAGTNVVAINRVRTVGANDPASPVLDVFEPGQATMRSLRVELTINVSCNGPNSTHLTGVSFDVAAMH
jgi:hypothetical protein